MAPCGGLLWGIAAGLIKIFLVGDFSVSQGYIIDGACALEAEIDTDDFAPDDMAFDRIG